ncbi:MAG: arginine--tRNA ligase [Deltaproteobacteria bacterium]|nr:arginine--tRNA ligase [Deltaproteobacteria bacterium]
MKEKLTGIIKSALGELAAEGLVPGGGAEPQLSIPKHEGHGDYATNVALSLAKSAGKPPRAIAEALAEKIGDGGGLLSRVEIAGPGFLNFFLRKAGLFDVVKRIEEQGDAFGRVDAGAGRRVLVEFVSANPTGPLHVGHGRGAVQGDALASVLAAAGYAVAREYYVNDAGVQIQNLGRSTFLRYRQLIEGRDEPLPEGLYQGDYIRDHARALREERGDGVTEDDVPEISQWTAQRILAEIDGDLGALGVRFDGYFHEHTLYDAGAVDRCLDDLRARDLAYEQDGALWFRTTKFGDEKDRVLVKSGGEKTYLAADIAYHADKLRRGYDELIDIWGADHHGYIPRMKAAIEALGKNPDTLSVMLIQMVSLLRAGERVSMSTRAGEFVTLRDLTDEVGADATRFFFLMRRYDSQLDFDVDLAKEQSNKNPVYYVQYMHARVCSIYAKMAQEGRAAPAPSDEDFARLTEPEEAQIAQFLAELPDVVARAAQSREAHRLTTYLSDLAGMFHPYYFKHRVLVDDERLMSARLRLCTAVRQVTRNVLGILGLSAPETM